MGCPYYLCSFTTGVLVGGFSCCTVFFLEFQPYDWDDCNDKHMLEVETTDQM